MSVQIPVLGVVLAALSAMVIGTLWYSTAMFGKSWMKMLGVSEKDMKKNMPKATAWLVLVSLLTAYILAHFINYAHFFNGGSWLSAGLVTALWVWLGFALTAIIAHGVFDPRDKKILVINSGNRLVTLLFMGAILGAFL